MPSIANRSLRTGRSRNWADKPSPTRWRVPSVRTPADTEFDLSSRRSEGPRFRTPAAREARRDVRDRIQGRARPRLLRHEGPQSNPAPGVIADQGARPALWRADGLRRLV